MTQSVTFIAGKIWQRRSVTWNRNAMGKLEASSAHLPAADDPAAGDGPDNAAPSAMGHSFGLVATADSSCWDSVVSGRSFERRTRTT